MARGDQALDRLIADYSDVRTVLDIGSGAGAQARKLRGAGKLVTTVSLKEPADIIGDYLDQSFDVPFDAIWASHVLEHQPNVNRFLRKCFNDLRDDGVMAVTVPPLKELIVGGHLTLWNAGLLLYNLIIAGFDCRSARCSGVYGYNISIIVRKKTADLPDLDFDCGDIDRLSKFFPVEVHQGFDGRLAQINW